MPWASASAVVIMVAGWHATIPVMSEIPVRVRLSEPELAGEYVVEERHDDGSLLLRPDTSVRAMERRAGLRPMSEEEFEEVFGGLPRDGEG
jgi:hypothetical protein